MMEWNPRYLAYCRATGEPDPEKALARDVERYPGGRMAGFTLWISGSWAEWDVQHMHPANHVRDDVEQKAFTRWLDTWGTR